MINNLLYYWDIITPSVQASRKITERRLKWYGHVMRMEEDHVVRRVMTKAILGGKEERETKGKVEGCVQEGHADCRTERAMKETGLSGKRRSTTIAATPDDGNSQRKRRRITPSGHIFICISFNPVPTINLSHCK